MNKSLINDPQMEQQLNATTTAHVPTSSQTIAKPNVVGSVCDHPNRQREYYRDGCYKCWECHKIIVAN